MILRLLILLLPLSIRLGQSNILSLIPFYRHSTQLNSVDT